MIKFDIHNSVYERKCSGLSWKALSVHSQQHSYSFIHEGEIIWLVELICAEPNFGKLSENTVMSCC